MTDKLATNHRPPSDGAPLGPVPEVVVVGTGYVGLTSAACFAHVGRTVVALDIDEAKIAELNAGVVPILEADLDELVCEGMSAGRLHFATNPEILRRAPVVMLCLPTPSAVDGGLDLSFIESACDQLARLLPTGAVVATKSTVPVGTHQLVERWLNRPDLHVVSNPEFLREGTAVSDFLHPDRIVIGGSDSGAVSRVEALYSGVAGPRQLTDATSAELVKYAANTFLATKLSFVNEMSRLCDVVGADIEAVTEGMASDHRIGSSFLAPGPGWGGSCFPKDTKGMSHLARQAGLCLPVSEGANLSNVVHQEHVASRIAELCPVPLHDAKIAVWGATFKAGTDDTRDSPSIEIIRRLLSSGASVTVFDPAASSAAVPASMAADPYSACDGADMLVVLTEWGEFASADLGRVARGLLQPVVFDTRYVIDEHNATAAGLHLHRPGRPSITTAAELLESV